MKSRADAVEARRVECEFRDPVVRRERVALGAAMLDKQLATQPELVVFLQLGIDGVSEHARGNRDSGHFFFFRPSQPHESVALCWTRETGSESVCPFVQVHGLAERRSCTGSGRFEHHLAIDFQLQRAVEFRLKKIVRTQLCENESGPSRGKFPW